RVPLYEEVAAAIANALGGGGLFVIVPTRLYGGTDTSLRNDAAGIAEVPPPDFSQTFYHAPSLKLSGAYSQVVESDGTQTIPPGQYFGLPVDQQTLRVAASQAGPYYRNVDLAGHHLRILA